MTMTVLTILQILGILAAYTLMVGVLPALVWKGRLGGFAFPERLMIYVLMGNCFMMNSVFVLELLHVSGPWTLRLLTLAILCLGLALWHKKGLYRVTLEMVRSLQRLLTGTMGWKSFLGRMGGEMQRILFGRKRQAAGCEGDKLIGGGEAGSEEAGKVFLGVTEFVCFLLMVLGISYILGGDQVHDFGYSYSDLVLHNKWINEMEVQHLFADGVYPFGYHTVLYYLHTVFGFHTVTLLRLFGVVQGIYIGLMLWALLRSLCQARFVPYLAVASYFGLSIWHSYTLDRYTGPLPQEFGMMFLLPCLYFLIQYCERENSKISLVAFGLGISMTFSVHFYVTLIAGLGCIAIAILYLPSLFREKRFLYLVAAGLLSFILAAYPMAIALAQGTPMQGSMNWALGIISGKEQTSESMTDGEESLTETEARDGEILGDPTHPAVGGAEDGNGGQRGNHGRASELQALARDLYRAMRDSISKTMFEKEYVALHPFYSLILLGIIGAGVLLGLLGIFLDRAYGRCLLAFMVFQIFLLVLLSSTELGLPTLMDDNRARIFFLYGFGLAAGLTLDGFLYLPLGRRRLLAVEFLSLVVLMGAVTAAWGLGLVRQPLDKVALEKNGATISFYNIIRTRDRFSWTIVSPNDEHQMGLGRGYHVETLDFLNAMEEYDKDSALLIPTEYVYVFVEKKPLDYYLTYYGSGQEISEEGASRPMPFMAGLSVYFTENRWILMSKLFYWAREFQRLYPNEMKVYYEDEEFICYEIHQNTYSTFNFAVDYGFNRVAGGKG